MAILLHQAIPKVVKMWTRAKQFGGSRVYHSPRKSLLSGSRLLVTSALRHVDIVQDVANPSKNSLEHHRAQLCWTCRIAVTPLAFVPLSLAINAAHKSMVSLEYFLAMLQVLLPPPKPAKLLNKNSVNTRASKKRSDLDL